MKELPEAITFITAIVAVCVFLCTAVTQCVSCSRSIEERTIQSKAIENEYAKERLRNGVLKDGERYEQALIDALKKGGAKTQ